jgi:hypothetical protein
MRIHKEGPTKLCEGCGRFMPMDDDREFLSHKQAYSHPDEWCVPETPGPGYEWGLTGDSLIIFNELHSGNEVNVLAGTLAFSIRPLVQLGVQTFQIRKKGRKRLTRSPILGWHQVANWVQGLQLDEEKEN